MLTSTSWWLFGFLTKGLHLVSLEFLYILKYLKIVEKRLLLDVEDTAYIQQQKTKGQKHEENNEDNRLVERRSFENCTLSSTRRSPKKLSSERKKRILEDPALTQYICARQSFREFKRLSYFSSAWCTKGRRTSSHH